MEAYLLMQGRCVVAEFSKRLKFHTELYEKQYLADSFERYLLKLGLMPLLLNGVIPAFR